MKGVLHVWEDGKALLTIVEGELTNEMAWDIVQGLKRANGQAALLAFNFPVEVIHEQGGIEFIEEVGSEGTA
jgi:hypothetical protein